VKETVAILKPKTERAKKRMGYHGELWYVKQQVEMLKFSTVPGPYFGVRSRDGNAFLWIKEENDPDFEIKIRQ